jgi:uncharacterized phage protein (TIGR02216 family)
MRLPPSVFWAMSLAEWRALVEGRLGGAAAHPLRRTELEQLMQTYPDISHG